VAIVGVICPFAVGYLAAFHIFQLPNNVSIFIGATLTATSVGITARTLADLGRLKTPEAQVILGAAVVDDVIGLIILAVVTGLTTTGRVDVSEISEISVMAIGFLVGAIVIGILIAPRLLALVKHLRTSGMLTISALLFCLILSYLASKLHLASIVGAFAAGLVLARTDDLVHIQERIKPIGDFFTPIFFVLLGLSVNLSVFNPFNPKMHDVLLLMLALTLIAVTMKLLSGFGVVKKGINRIVVGVGMIPRGEVGLIFASIGLSRGIIDSGEYASIVAIVVITTFITPPMLKLALRISKPVHSEADEEQFV
jgi:Kef-type K+ transport system membrane component KefB